MTGADIEEVVEIERWAHPRPWARDVFLDELQREFAHVDVLREASGGQVRAFVNYWQVRDEIHILNVATHLESRGRGHATRLLDHVIGFARAGQCRYLTLEVRRSNEIALHLYRRRGFRPVGVRPRYYADNEEDAIVMLLDLGA